MSPSKSLFNRPRNGEGHHPGKNPARKVDEFHVPQSRTERLRVWAGRLPRMRLYILLLALTWLCLTALVSLDSRLLSYVGLQEENRGYEVGSVAQEDVYAPRNVTYEDELATQQARQQAPP